jgi:hypothetical protein
MQASVATAPPVFVHPVFKALQVAATPFNAVQAVDAKLLLA